MNRILTILGMLAVTLVPAQEKNGPRGQWNGTLELPNRTVRFQVDLDRTEKGWVGSLAVPDQGASGMPLADIRQADGKWSFRIDGVPGEPTFAGKLSEDGQSLDGELTQGGNAMALKFKRVGDPKVELPKMSPPVAAEFVGEWEGTLEGPNLRLRIILANQDGGSKATLVSIDQGNSKIAASGIEQKGAKLLLAVKMVNGEYAGEINKEGTELNGTWSQGGNSMPLTLKKSK